MNTRTDSWYNGLYIGAAVFFALAFVCFLLGADHDLNDGLVSMTVCLFFVKDVVRPLPKSHDEEWQRVLNRVTYPLMLIYLVMTFVRIQLPFENALQVAAFVLCVIGAVAFAVSLPMRKKAREQLRVRALREKEMPRKAWE